MIPIFVIDPELWGSASAMRRSLLAAHLRALDGQLAELGGRLRIVHGRPADVLGALTEDLDVSTVNWNADYTPYARRRDRTVASMVSSEIHHGQVIHPPGSVRTKAGGRYRVFTPYHRTWEQREVAAPDTPEDAPIADDPGAGIPAEGAAPMPAGSEAAMDRLERFEERVERYPQERNRPDLNTTSQLSIDLKWGTLGPRTVLDVIGTHTDARAAFVRQLAWRDFYADLLDDSPESMDAALRPEYREIAWEDDEDGFTAWTAGETGYPIVDAGMRQLAGEGWIHNRVRMIVASFLVKDLLIDWRRGERYFRHHLLDVDVASNVGNWQWAAGTGADAAPYFRIFNPVTQSEKFDPNGDYIRRWVPELADIDPADIHAPWDAGPLDLAAAGVTLGETYPFPIIEHGFARERALERYKSALA